MRWVALCLGLSGVLCAALTNRHAERPTMLVITGDIAGYLSPCGCTTPMTGGITRQATLIHRLSGTYDTVLLSNGAMAGGNSPQEEMKVSTLAQTFGALKAAAINLSPQDARLGLGVLQTVQNLSENKLVCGNAEPLNTMPIRATQEANGLLIGGIASHPEDLAGPLGTRPISTGDAVRKLLIGASQSAQVPVVLLDGGEAEAKGLAEQFPAIKLIVYRSNSDPPHQPITVGETVLVTPGEFGKSVVTLTFDGKAFAAYQVVPLGPSYADDAQISRFYQAYLRSVARAGFLDQTPRKPSKPLAGSAKCASCHKNSFQIWAHTKHAVGLKSLEIEGHDRDPDCVSCHVVGLNLVGGFRSRAKTPDLASVGCESCHGPAASHVANPRRIKLPKVGTQMCLDCHRADRSPGFNPLTKWKQIAHQ